MKWPGEGLAGCGQSKGSWSDTVSGSLLGINISDCASTAAFCLLRQAREGRTTKMSAKPLLCKGDGALPFAITVVGKFPSPPSSKMWVRGYLWSNPPPKLLESLMNSPVCVCGFCEKEGSGSPAPQISVVMTISFLLLLAFYSLLMPLRVVLNHLS